MNAEQARGLPPDVVAVITARAREIAAVAPVPTDEQMAQLRRWFTPHLQARAQAQSRTDAA
jgi:hypothetical protein